MCDYNVHVHVHVTYSTDLFSTYVCYILKFTKTISVKLIFGLICEKYTFLGCMYNYDVLKLLWQNNYNYSPRKMVVNLITIQYCVHCHCLILL